MHISWRKSNTISNISLNVVPNLLSMWASPKAMKSHLLSPTGHTHHSSLDPPPAQFISKCEPIFHQPPYMYFDLARDFCTPQRQPSFMIIDWARWPNSVCFNPLLLHTQMVGRPQREHPVLRKIPGMVVCRPRTPTEISFMSLTSKSYMY
jgi:hypothetical protein